MANRELLTPRERRVLAMRDEGMSSEEIGTRINRSPEHVERIIEWTEIPRSRRPGARRKEPLSPIERRVLAMRKEGQDRDEIAERFQRSPRFIKQVEGLAHLRKGLSLLSSSGPSA